MLAACPGASAALQPRGQVMARAAMLAGSTAWRRCEKGLFGNMRPAPGACSRADSAFIASTRDSQSPVAAPAPPLLSASQPPSRIGMLMLMLCKQ